MLHRDRRMQPGFHPPEDHGDFRHAAIRCVGIGNYRRSGGGTMCPSFMVTREEKHTTRGRARLLFEMVQVLFEGTLPVVGGAIAFDAARPGLGLVLRGGEAARHTGGTVSIQTSVRFRACCCATS